MIRLLAGVLLICLATPAHAAFSADEKRQVETLVNIGRGLSQGLRAVGTAIGAQQESTALLQRAASHLTQAQWELCLTMGYLMNTNGEAGYSIPSPADRAARIQKAWFHLERIEMFASGAIDTLRGGSSSAAHDATVWLAGVRGAVRSVDRTLAYTEPGNGRIIGPHGDYYRAQWELFRAWTYLAATMTAAIAQYPNGQGVRWADLVRYSPRLYDVYAQGMARVADIDTTREERALRAELNTLPAGPFGVQFWLILRYAEVLSVERLAGDLGVPGLFFILLDALARGPGDLWFARNQLADAWRHSDTALWFILGDFPGCNVQVNPMGCAALLPSQAR